MPTKISLEECKKRLSTVHGDLVTLDDFTYSKISEKARFIDKEFGEWWATPASVLKGRRHTSNSTKINGKLTKLGVEARRIPISEVLERIKDKLQNTVILDETTFKDTRTKARFFDKDYGEFWTQPCVVMQGHRHPNHRRDWAHDFKMLPIATILKRINDKHKGSVILDTTTYKGTEIKARFVDEIFGEWWTNPCFVMNGSRHPKYARSKRIKNKFIEQYPLNPDVILQQQGLIIPLRRNMSGIYCILNLKNGKRYVGLSKNIKARWRSHIYALDTQQHRSFHLQRSWNKYGENAFLFFVVEEAPVAKLIEKEKYWINEFKTRERKYGYNID